MFSSPAPDGGDSDHVVALSNTKLGVSLAVDKSSSTSNRDPPKGDAEVKAIEEINDALR